MCKSDYLQSAYKVLTKCAMCAHYSVSVGCFQQSFSRHVHRICFCKKSLFWAFHKIFTSYYCNLAWGHISILKYQIITLRYEMIAGTFYSYLQNFWPLKSFLGECPRPPFLLSYMHQIFSGPSLKISCLLVIFIHTKQKWKDGSRIWKNHSAHTCT